MLVAETCHNTTAWHIRETRLMSTSLLTPALQSPVIRRKEQCVSRLNHGKYTDSIWLVEANVVTRVSKRGGWRRMCEYCIPPRDTHCGQLRSWPCIHRTSFIVKQQWQKLSLAEGWSRTGSTYTSPEPFFLQVFMKIAFCSCSFLIHFTTAVMICSLCKAWTCNDRILEKLS